MRRRRNRKTKKDNKDGWRKKKEKEATDKHKPIRESTKPKLSLKPVEVKKEPTETLLVKSVSMNEKSSNTLLDKNPEVETTHKSNVGISKIIINPSYNSKANASKSSVSNPVKTNVQTDVCCGSSNSSESEPTSSKTRNRSNTSHSSTNQSIQNSNSTNTTEQNTVQNQRNYRGAPLSISSPCIDLETIRIAKAKDFAHDFFNKKLETDIYKHVATLTEEANKMMECRILAYKRLDYCIASLFPSKNTTSS